MTVSGGEVRFAINEGIVSSVEKSSEAIGLGLDFQSFVFLVVLVLIPASVMGVLAYFATAKDEVETEIKEVKDERDGFNAFRTRIENLPTNEIPAETSHAKQTFDTRNQPVAVVRSAFEETILTLSHYRRTYGDDVDSHLALEFDPDLVASLHHQKSLTPVLQQKLRDEAKKAAESRTAVLAELQREREILHQTESDMDRILSELRSMNQQPLREKDFTRLHREYDRLVSLEGTLEEISANRQSEIRQTYRKLRLGFSDPTLQEYLYGEIETTYPVLATVVQVDHLIERAKRNVVRALTNRV